MPIIFDGYNLLKAIQRQDDFEALTDVGLCRTLSEYLVRSRSHGHIIFDGIGPPDKTDFGGLDNLEVYFSGQDCEADDIIEQKIEDSSAPKSLIIVTNDNMIRNAASRRKANPVGCEIFWHGLVQQLDKKPPKPEPQEKRKGISGIEVDQWLDLFDIDE